MKPLRPRRPWTKEQRLIAALFAALILVTLVWLYLDAIHHAPTGESRFISAPESTSPSP